MAARSYTVQQYEHYMKKILAEYPQVGDYLEKHHNLLWMRCHFSSLVKCDHINNNLAESFNSWIKDVKDLPVVELADRLRAMMMQLIVKRRRIGERLEGHILPAIIQEINGRTRGLAHIRVNLAAYPTAEISEVTSNHSVLRHVVDLESHCCTCGEWQLCGKPCLHALAYMISLKNTNMEEYVNEYFSLARFRAAYDGLVRPITDKSQWPQVDVGFKMLPPLGKRSSGRPRKNRIPSFLDKLNFSKGKNRCKKCKELGHRQAACPTNGPKKKKPKKPTRAATSQRDAPSSPSVPTPPRSRLPALLQESPGPVTRRRFVMSLPGEGIKAVNLSPSARTRSQTAMQTSSSTRTKSQTAGQASPPPMTRSQAAARKLTPRKRKK